MQQSIVDPDVHWPLEEGETLLWRARPETGVPVVWSALPGSVTLLIATAMPLGALWLIREHPVSIIPDGLEWSLLIAAGATLWVAIRPHLHEAQRRKNTRYAMTDRRIMAIDLRRGRRGLESLPLDAPLQCQRLRRGLRLQGEQGNSLHVGPLSPQALQGLDRVLAERTPTPNG